MKLWRLGWFVGQDKNVVTDAYNSHWHDNRLPVSTVQIDIVGPVQMWVLVIEEIGRERITMTAWESETVYEFLANWLWEHWTPEDATQFGPAVRQELTQDIIDEWFNLYDFEYQYHIDLTEVQ